MVSIVEVRPHENQRLEIFFDDRATAQINLGELVPDVPLTRPLRDNSFFQRVQIYPGGDGIFWPNDFDLGSDMLHDFAHKEVH
jgi:hypothetical protein